MQFYQRSDLCPDDGFVKMIAEECGIPEVLARILLRRGIDDIPAYINPSEDDICDPFMFEGMEAAVGLIDAAMAAGDKIAVFSDYDADGTLGGAILFRALRALGGDVISYIPDRFTEGYGTNPAAVKKLSEQGVRLLITVDCGIRSVSDIDIAKSLGMRSVILDHHECAELPQADAIIDAKRPGEDYPNAEICGAGVAWQVVRALGDPCGDIDLAAIATIGDIVSLVGENRSIAALGLQKLRVSPHPGIAALAQEAGIDIERLTARDVSFGLVPRINAAGRMAHARIAFELFTATDSDTREKAAKELNRLNTERQQRQKLVFEQAEEKAVKCLGATNIFIAAESDWDKGIVGLAASKLTEKYHRPAVVLSNADGMLTGSARSIEGINIYDVLNSAESLYTRFGGHAQAAGLTFSAEKLPEFTSLVNDYIEEHCDRSVFERRAVYDDALKCSDINMELANALALMEPTGADNPSASLLIRGAEIASVKPMGKGEHFRFDISDGKDKLPGVRFFAASPVIESQCCDVLGTAAINEFNGRKSLQFITEALSPDDAGMLTDIMEKSANDYMRGFLREAAALTHVLTNKNELIIHNDATEMFDAARESMRASPVGVLVAACTSFGARRIVMEDWPLKRLLVGGAIPAGTGDNAIALCAAPGVQPKHYKEVFLCGAASAACRGAHIVLSEGVLLAYRREMQKYFLSAEALRSLMPKVRAAVADAEGFSGVSGLLAELCEGVPGLSQKQAYFAFRVFLEAKLLKVKKNVRIHIIYDETGADPELTKLWRMAQRFAEGGVRLD